MPRGAKSRMRRTETPKLIFIKFCMVLDIPDVVTLETHFGDHRLWGFAGGGQIPASPIDFHRRPTRIVSYVCVYSTKRRAGPSAQLILVSLYVALTHTCIIPS